MANREECVAIVRQLWPYLDGALPDHLQERVVAHLQGCESCRSHFDFQREFLVAVRSAGALDGEFDRLRVRVLAALTANGFSEPDFRTTRSEQDAALLREDR